MDIRKRNRRHRPSLNADRYSPRRSRRLLSTAARVAPAGVSGVVADRFAGKGRNAGRDRPVGPETTFREPNSGQKKGRGDRGFSCEKSEGCRIFFDLGSILNLDKPRDKPISNRNRRPTDDSAVVRTPSPPPNKLPPARPRKNEYNIRIRRPRALFRHFFFWGGGLNFDT